MKDKVKMKPMDIVQPPPSITFHPNENSDKEIGTLTWEKGKFSFKGKAEESAKIFFNYIKPMVKQHWEDLNKRKK